MADSSDLEEAFAALTAMGTLLLETSDPKRYEINREMGSCVHAALVGSRIAHLNIENLKVALDMARGERDALARKLEGVRREAKGHADEQRRVIRGLVGSIAESVRMRAREEAALKAAERYVTSEDLHDANGF